MIGVYDPNNVFWSIEKKYQDRIDQLDKSSTDFKNKEYELIKLKEHQIVWHTEMLRNFTIISWMVCIMVCADFFDGNRTINWVITSLVVAISYSCRLRNSNKKFEADPLVLETE